MQMPGVLAGFDGSAPNARALEWAAGEARIRGVPLTVCNVWARPDPSAVTPITPNPRGERACSSTLRAPLP